MERHLLVVLAHPDDESFACGGTIALHSRAGTPVTYVCATRGEMGRRMGQPPRTTRESLADLREQELRAACRALGIGDLRLLGIRDKTVEFVDSQALARRIGAILDEVQPSLVITFHPQYGAHPDHNAIGAATIRAVSERPAASRPPVHCVRNPLLRVEVDLPEITVDITPVRAAKEAALVAHASQTEGMADLHRDRYKNEPEQLARLERRMKQEHFWVYAFPESHANRSHG